MEDYRYNSSNSIENDTFGMAVEDDDSFDSDVFYDCNSVELEKKVSKDEDRPSKLEAKKWKSENKFDEIAQPVFIKHTSMPNNNYENDATDPFE